LIYLNEELNIIKKNNKELLEVIKNLKIKDNEINNKEVNEYYYLLFKYILNKNN
jgi:hypothetical protein